MRSIFLFTLLIGGCGMGYAANKCMIDGKATYQDSPCPTNAVASKVQTHNRPMDPANETVEQKIDRLMRPNGNSQLPSSPPRTVPWTPAADPAVAPSKPPEHARKSVEERIAAEMKKSDDTLAAAKAACGGTLPTGPSIGMTEKNFRSCTVVGVLVAPDSINVTETASGVSKQFVYSSNFGAAGFKFLYTRNGVITAIQR